MTNEEQLEFWKNQTFLTMNDLKRMSNGKFFVSQSAMQKIATAYGLSLPAGKIYLLREAQDIILKAEIEKRKGKKEEDKLENRVVAFLSKVPDSRKEDGNFVAKELVRIFGVGQRTSIIEGIELAGKTGVIPNPELLKKSYDIQRNCEFFKYNISVVQKDQTLNQEAKEQQIAKFLYMKYKQGYPYGKLYFVLHQDTTIDEETRKRIADCFYTLLQPDIEEKYKDTKMRGTLLAKDVLKTYDGFDMSQIFAILSVTNPEAKIPYAQHCAYQIEDEASVKAFLKVASSRHMKAEDIVSELKDMKLEYPDSEILKTIQIMENSGLILPYQDIYSLMAGKKLEEPSPSLEEPEEDVDLIDISRRRPVAKIYDPADLEEAPSETHLEEAIVQPRKSYRIVKRERAMKSADRKTTISCLVFAAGAASTMVLTSVFGVNPAIAAKNCYASISAFASGSAAFAQVLPNSKDFIALLATIGTTFAGTISWLKNRKKYVALKTQAEREEEFSDTFNEINEEIGRNVSEVLDAERGGRAR